MKNSTILVTGAAGFIGYHLSERLLSEGKNVIGFDNLSEYYDIRLKKARLERLIENPGFQFVYGDLENQPRLEQVFRKYAPSMVVNLAAQAGVRYSLVNPHAYVHSNIAGFMNVLEMCRKYPVGHLVYASTSSVYGTNSRIPFSVHDNADHPVSLYAATKKTNELMAHTYSHLFGLPATGLRFFTVYGPWGRPDMSLFLFTQAILEGKPIQVFNNGNMKRDYTYIDDIVEGIVRVMDSPPKPNPDWDADHPDPATSRAPYKLYNIGNSQPVDLMSFIQIIEEKLGISALKQFQPLQPGDVHETYADISDLTRDTGFQPVTPIEEGVRKFVEWYVDFYEVQR